MARMNQILRTVHVHNKIAFLLKTRLTGTLGARVLFFCAAFGVGHNPLVPRVIDRLIRNKTKNFRL